MTTTVAELAATHSTAESYAYLDEDTKRNVRRAVLKALAIPGWQVPFASREMPVARGGAVADCRSRCRWWAPTTS